jgi:chromate transport protein ChrA
MQKQYPGIHSVFEIKATKHFISFSKINIFFYIAVVTTFWPLGLVAFGGPQAHVAILREHLVVRRDWINEEEFMELFAIGQVRNKKEK